MADSMDLKALAAKARQSMLLMGQGQATHYGSSLSCVELMLCVYLGKRAQDKVILSKGHASLAHFAVLNALGLIDDQCLTDYSRNGSPFCVHEHQDLKRGIEMTSGSLGLGVSFALGKIMGSQKDGRDDMCYVITGNGELNEGSTYEAMLYAGVHHVSDLIVVVDHNGMQLDGDSSHVLKADYAPLIEALGFEVRKCDGHDGDALNKALFEPHDKDKPLCVIASTVKGKGISFMEHNNAYHHAKLTDEEHAKAQEEIRGSYAV